MAKILIVDDSSISRTVMRDWLSERGHEVVELDSPALFVGSLVRERPNLVVMDVDMPGIQGNRVVDTVRGTGLLRCPVVLCSARSEEELFFMAEQCGAAASIRKSNDRHAFLSVVEKQLS